MGRYIPALMLIFIRIQVALTVALMFAWVYAYSVEKFIFVCTLNYFCMWAVAAAWGKWEQYRLRKKDRAAMRRRLSI